MKNQALKVHRPQNLLLVGLVIALTLTFTDPAQAGRRRPPTSRALERLRTYQRLEKLDLEEDIIKEQHQIIQAHNNLQTFQTLQKQGHAQATRQQILRNAHAQSDLPRIQALQRDHLNNARAAGLQSTQALRQRVLSNQAAQIQAQQSLFERQRQLYGNNPQILQAQQQARANLLRAHDTQRQNLEQAQINQIRNLDHTEVKLNELQNRQRDVFDERIRQQQRSLHNSDNRLDVVHDLQRKTLDNVSSAKLVEHEIDRARLDLLHEAERREFLRDQNRYHRPVRHHRRSDNSVIVRNDVTIVNDIDIDDSPGAVVIVDNGNPADSPVIHTPPSHHHYGHDYYRHDSYQRYESCEVRRPRYPVWHQVRDRCSDTWGALEIAFDFSF